jgi:hypothetical protein
VQCIPEVDLLQLCHCFHYTSNRIAPKELIPAQITTFMSSSKLRQTLKSTLPDSNSIQQAEPRSFVP